jgi:hypothetical protein
MSPSSTGSKNERNRVKHVASRVDFIVYNVYERVYLQNYANKASELVNTSENRGCPTTFSESLQGGILRK